MSDLFDDLDEIIDVERPDNKGGNTEDDERSSHRIPEAMGNDYPDVFKRVLLLVKSSYENMPEIDHDEINAELEALHIKSSPLPTLQVLSREMERVQAAKDRLAEIYTRIVPACSGKKRFVDMLMSSWMKYAEGKTKDLRDADATIRFAEYLTDLANTEMIKDSCLHVLKNLDSLHNNLSRRITIFQLELSLRDVGRSALPDYEFDENSSPEDSVVSSSKSTSKKAISEEPEEESF